MFDVDRSGAITVDEIKKILGGAGTVPPPQASITIPPASDKTNSQVFTKPINSVAKAPPQQIDDSEW